MKAQAAQGANEMSDVDRLEGAEVVFLSPKCLITDHPAVNVRPYKGSEEYQLNQMKAVADLSQSLGKKQLDTVIVIPATEEHGIKTKNGCEQMYLVVAGNRRVKAANQENERRSKAGQSLLKVRCVVSNSADPFADALESNVVRQQLGVMDKVALIPIIKERYKLDDSPLSKKKIGKMLGFGQDDPGSNPLASVLNYERIAHAPKQMQEDLQSGRIAMRTALQILDKAPGAVEEVMKKAEEVQKRKVEAEVSEKVKAGKIKPEKAAEEVEKKAKGRISETTVTEAIREVQETGTGAGAVATSSTADKTPTTASTPAVVRPLQRNRKEILEWFESQDGPGNGHADSAARVFVQTLLKWAAGEGVASKMDKRLQAAWEEAVKGSHKGTEGAKEQKQQKVSKTLKANQVRMEKAAVKKAEKQKAKEAKEAAKTEKAAGKKDGKKDGKGNGGSKTSPKPPNAAQIPPTVKPEGAKAGKGTTKPQKTSGKDAPKADKGTGKAVKATTEKSVTKAYSKKS